MKWKNSPKAAAFIGMGEAVNPLVHDSVSLMLFSVFPFNLLKHGVTSLVTVSGLLIDENQQVLDHDFEPISGLYATGNCSGCRFGFQYTTSLPGQSISIAQTLGRILGSRLAGKEIS